VDFETGADGDLWGMIREFVINTGRKRLRPLTSI